jgi:hypothetical protein
MMKNEYFHANLMLTLISTDPYQNFSSHFHIEQTYFSTFFQQICSLIIINIGLHYFKLKKIYSNSQTKTDAKTGIRYVSSSVVERKWIIYPNVCIFLAIPLMKCLEISVFKMLQMINFITG